MVIAARMCGGGIYPNTIMIRLINPNKVRLRDYLYKYMCLFIVIMYYIILVFKIDIERKRSREKVLEREN